MLIVMKNDATAENIQHVCEMITRMKLTAHPMPGAQRTAICITGNNGTVQEQPFLSLPGVFEVIRVSKPYKLVSREFKPDNTIIPVNGVNIGQDFCMIAGPCSVEAEPITLRIAQQLHDQGVRLFRAGAYKPRTSPYGFQGLGEQGLEILATVKQRFNMGIVSEIMDHEQLEKMIDVVDIFQVGARNMQNMSLLKKLGEIRKPILLKRGMCATLEEVLLAAEYIMAGGNYQVILCERGIRTFNTHARNTLDISIIPELQRISHLPVIVDPSHAAGKTALVAPLALGAVGAGAQGLIIETHDDPANAYSDGQQALHPAKIADLMKPILTLIELRNVAT
ncbi:MAG: 3-deoxy-7-phosphoheptulonate synthase [Legionellales bacterium]|nr:3-deoxy-7-phosphoheptulonate synthase [Legionellales bacterium]